MYFYLFDSFLNNKKYRRKVNEIENRTAELNIEGKYAHLTVLKNFEETLKRAVEQKFKTIVLIGDLRTLYKGLNVLKEDFSSVLGFIPIEEEKTNQLLGIPSGKFAVDVLATRLIENLDLGKANNKYFLFSLKTKGESLILEGENQNYQISLQGKQEIIIANLFKISQHLANPQDGFLETIISPYSQGIFRKKRAIEGLFYNKKLFIDSKGRPLPVLLDNSEFVKTPVKISILPRKIKMIVGKERLF